MADESRPTDIAKAEVLAGMPAPDEVLVQPDVPFSTVDGTTLTMDVYRPAGPVEPDGRPAVILVAGYPDDRFARFVGCRFKDMASVACWARMIAATGFVAIAYENRDPSREIEQVLRHLRQNAHELGIRPDALGLWASSGNAPLALSLLAGDHGAGIRCAALCYPYTMDRAGHSDVAAAAATFKFALPFPERSVADLPNGVALLIARAGRDEMPGLNESLDRFVYDALRRNLAVTVTNHQDGPHAFDLAHDSPTTRAMIGQVLDFQAFHLAGRPIGPY